MNTIVEALLKPETLKAGDLTILPDGSLGKAMVVDQRGATGTVIGGAYPMTFTSPVEMTSTLVIPEVQKQIKAAVGEMLTSPPQAGKLVVPEGPKVVEYREKPEGGPGIIVPESSKGELDVSNTDSIGFHSSQDGPPKQMPPLLTHKQHQHQAHLGKKAAHRRVKSKLSKKARRRNRS